MKKFHLNGHIGLPPNDGEQYLVQNLQGDWFLCCWWSSEEIFEHCGNNEKGQYLDREGFTVQDIVAWVCLNNTYTN